MRELVDKIDPDEFARQVAEPVNPVIEELANSLLAKYHRSDRLIALVNREVRSAIDKQAGLARRLVVLAFGGRCY